jgi:beta-N-acetylhexosaminidase
VNKSRCLSLRVNADTTRPASAPAAKDGEKWVAATMRSLSLEEKVGQMLMGRCFLDYAGFKSPDYKELKDDLQKYHIGG